MTMHPKAFRSIASAAALLAVAAAPVAQAQLTYTQTVESTPGLLAYYQFSGSTNSNVNGYTGALTTGASLDATGSGPALADDPSNQALRLNGTSGNELQSSLRNGVATSGSIVAWVNLSVLPSSAGRIFYVAGQSAYTDDFDLQFQTDNLLYFYTDSGGHVASLTPLTFASLGTWIFVAATFTAGLDRNLYINGVLVNSNIPPGHTDSGSPFTIGYSDVFGGRAFSGDIDEVAFYGTDLSASQVAAIYSSSLVAVPEPAAGALMLGVASLGFAATLRRRGPRSSPKMSRFR